MSEPEKLAAAEQLEKDLGFRVLEWSEEQRKRHGKLSVAAGAAYLPACQSVLNWSTLTTRRAGRSHGIIKEPSITSNGRHGGSDRRLVDL